MIRRLALALVLVTAAATLGWTGRGLMAIPGRHGHPVENKVLANPAIVTAAGHGWTNSGIQGPTPAPGSCHYQHGANGELLPDPRCTPGAIDPAVQTETLRTTVCRPGGYTASVRPPEAITEPIKRKLMAAYGIPWNQARSYELDHLIELNAGGASDTRNLWPEPNLLSNGTTGSAFVHNTKDAVEAYTFHALCAGKVDLGALQRAMATNWVTAVGVLGLPPLPAGYRG